MTQRRTAQQANPEPEPPEGPDAAAPGLQPQLQDHIGRQLRALYDDILSQPVPDRFRELMERLDRVPGPSAETKK